jgi:hypothetical protein
VIIVFEKKADKEEVTEVTKIYKGYTKVVVDIEKEILSAGGEYHADCEQLLISNGSSQENLWGGGFRFNNKEVDFMALTNFKPSINHFTYEISLPEIREKVEKTIRKIFDNE